MTLPRFDPAVPIHFSTQQTETGSRIAYALAQADIIKPEDWQGECSKAVIKAFNRIDPLKKIKLGLSVYTDIEGANGDTSYEPDFAAEGDCLRERIKSLGDSEIGGLIFHSPSERVNAYVGERVQAMNKLEAGLGTGVLELLESGFDRTVGCINGHTMLGIAAYCYWQGEDDESMAMEEILDSEEIEIPNPGKDEKKCRRLTDKEREERMKTMDFYRRSDFDASFPDWCVDPKVQTQGRKVLNRRLQKYNRRHKFHGILTAAEDLAQSLTKERWEYKSQAHHFGDLSTSYLAPPLILRYKSEKGERDDTGRLLDEQYENECQSGETLMDLAHATFFPSENPKAIVAAFRHVEAMLKITRKAEALLELFATEIST